jgi:hypothetical protein
MVALNLDSQRAFDNSSAQAIQASLQLREAHAFAQS